MRAALLVCVLSDGDPAAAQPAGAPQAPGARWPAPTSSGLRWPSDWLEIGDDPRPPPSGIAIATPPTSGPVQLPKGWTFRFEAPAACTTCGDRLGAGIVNGNAPWRMSGALAWQGDTSALGVRLTGQRGARLPLFMTPSVSSQHVAAASEALLSDSRTQWQVTFSGEQTLLKSGGGTMSLFGDLFLPLGAAGRAPATDDAPVLLQKAFIGGVRIRF